MPNLNGYNFNLHPVKVAKIFLEIGILLVGIRFYRLFDINFTISDCFFVIALFFCVISLYYLPIGKVLLSNKLVLFCSFLFLIASLLSLALSNLVISLNDGVLSVLQYAYILFAFSFIFLFLIRDQYDVKKFLLFYIIAVHISIIIAILSSIMSPYLNMSYFMTGSGRYISTLSNPNAFGKFVVSIIPANILLVKLYKRLSIKIYYFVMTIFSIYAVFLTASFGSMVYGSIGLAIFIFIYVTFGTRRIRDRILIGILVPILLLAIIIWVRDNPPQIFEKRLSKAESTEQFEQLGSYEIKMELMKIGLNMIENHLIIGIGQEQAAYHTGLRHTIHNTYILIFLENGIFGFIAFMGLLLITLIRGIKYYIRCSGEDKIWALALLMIFIIDCLSHTTDTNLINRSSWVIIFIILATKNIKIPKVFRALPQNEIYINTPSYIAKSC